MPIKFERKERNVFAYFSNEFLNFHNDILKDKFIEFYNNNHDR